MGNKRGSQLYQADFSPRLPSLSSVAACPTDVSSSGHLLVRSKQPEFSSHYSDLNRSTMFVSDLLNGQTTNESNAQTNSNNEEPTTLPQQQSQQQCIVHAFKIQTVMCSRVGLSLEINRTHVFGKKFRDEHFEYEIEIRINSADIDETWSIFRRFLFKSFFKS